MSCLLNSLRSFSPTQPRFPVTCDMLIAIENTPLLSLPSADLAPLTSFHVSFELVVSYPPTPPMVVSFIDLALASPASQ